LDAAQTEIKSLQTQKTDLENQVGQLTVNLGKLTTLVEQQTALNNQLRDREEQVSTDLLEAMKKRDEALSQATRLQEDNAVLMERIKMLGQELESAKTELAAYKSQFGSIALAPARPGLRELAGKVTGVQRTESGSALALIDLGVNDGLQKGDRLSVVRGGSQYITDVVVDDALPGQSVVRVIPEMLVQGQQIREGDEVYTRFVLGGGS
jgi:predicted RNase H-like nuclease (RuvC/YqgF family)